MGLISNSDIKKFRSNYNSKQTLNQNRLDNCFEIGISFAETKLKNLAVEFAEWCGTFYSFESIYKKWDNARKEYTTQQLFEKFKEERKI